MYDSDPVRRRQGGGHLRGDVQRFARLQAAAGQPRAQGLAFDILGGDEVAGVHLTGLIDRDDVRVIEGGGGASRSKRRTRSASCV
jgi:hypothetical protein